MANKRMKTGAEKMKIEYVCPKCGAHLAWAFPDAMIGCPHCGKWVTAKNSKPLIKLYLQPDSNQLILFKLD